MEIVKLTKTMCYFYSKFINTTKVLKIAAKVLI